MIRLETERFAHASPIVRYEVNAADLIVAVNEEWQTFAVANGAPHLIREHVLGRSIWDFISDDTTRLVYDIVLRQVRDGGRSEFDYRCDSPERRRLMHMTISPAHAGHVVFESANVCVERHSAKAGAPMSLVRSCGWCKRAHADGHGWVEVGSIADGQSGDGSARAPAVTSGMCSDCYRRVLNSVDESSRAAASLLVARSRRAGRLADAPPPAARRVVRPRPAGRAPAIVIPSRYAS